MPLQIASRVELIPGYRLIERLGQGGFGEVWKAEAPGGLLKAVKIIHGCLSNRNLDATQITQELKALHRVKSVRHPYVLSLERFDIIDGRLVIVSELADCTLLDRLDECRAQGLPGIPRAELLRHMEEAAEALDLMNLEFNLQHLDIKPQNLFLLYNHVKVADFGLVKDLEGRFAQITSGVTAVYAAPETFEGVVSRFCDQYNLAVAFQELLTGQLPYNGTTGRQLMMQHLAAVPNLEPLPAAYRPVVARALSKKPEERFPSCLDFVHALRQADAADGSPPAHEAARARDADKAAFATAADPSSCPTPLLLRRRMAGEDTQHRNGPGPTPAAPPAPPALAAEAPGDKPAESFIAYEPPPAPPERPETTGAGVLRPALVVGLGGLARAVLQQVRKALRKRGAKESWPQLRLLHIDTDPDGYEQALREPDSLLAPGEALVTPVHRLAHYLQQPRARDQLAQWLPLGLLTSMARGQSTAGGWRAIGRLAFVSSAATIATRLREELTACSDEKALDSAVSRTGLGLRSTKPCVYVVTGLTGGTGSGMFLDIARALRQQLKQLGHAHAEVIGVLLVPAVDRSTPPRDIANAFAALTELKYFAGAGGGAGAADRGGQQPPFDRCVLLPMPAKADGAAVLGDLTALAGDFLCRELTTPLGRIADEGRALLGRPPVAGMCCQMFGAYWFSVPRRPLLQKVSHHIGDRLVVRWKRHDAQSVDDGLKTWVADQLRQAGLAPESLGAALQESCGGALRQQPAAYLQTFVARWAKGGPLYLVGDAEALPKALAACDELLGPSEREPSLDLSSPLATALKSASRTVAEQAERRLAELTLAVLAEPHVRLACKEETVHSLLGVPLTEAARQHKQRSEERCRAAVEALRQISPLHQELRTGGLFRAAAKARAAARIVEILAHYLAARWDGMAALALSQLLQGLQLNLHKYRRVVDCCHKRIGQFLKTFDDSAALDARANLGLGRYLLPFGCRSLDEAVRRILESLPPAEEDALRQNVGNLIRTTLRANIHLCTAPVAALRELREQIDHAVAGVAEQSLGRAHAASVYLQQHADHSDANDDLAGAFDEAQPDLAGSPGAARQELCILAVPPGPEGERFRELVSHALPAVPMRAATSIDDIVFYRERPVASLSDLPQLGPGAREIYQQFLASEQHTPHSRTDIVAW
jgi:hypothetical protein